MAIAQFGAKMLKLNKTKGGLISTPLQVKQTVS